MPKLWKRVRIVGGPGDGGTALYGGPTMKHLRPGNRRWGRYLFTDGAYRWQGDGDDAFVPTTSVLDRTWLFRLMVVVLVLVAWFAC